MKKHLAFLLCILMLISLLPAAIAEEADAEPKDVVMPSIRADESMSGMMIRKGDTAEFIFYATHGTYERVRYNFTIYITGTTTSVAHTTGEVTAAETRVTVSWDTSSSTVTPRVYTVEAYMEYYASGTWVRAIADFASFNVTVYGPIASGQCGQSLYWELSESYDLVITGTGIMYNYDLSSKPGWYSYRNNIRSITIEEGATSIGERAFTNISNLTSVRLPNTLTSIGEWAFYSNGGQYEVRIPEGVTVIGDSAFGYSTGLTSVTLPSSLTVLSNHTFQHCTSLREVEIPEGLVKIGIYVFNDCQQLCEIPIPTSLREIGNNSFKDCFSLSDVYYGSSRRARERNLTIGKSGNGCLTNATWHYQPEAFDGVIEWNTSDVQFKGSTPYVIYSKRAQTPRFTVKDPDGNVIGASNYTAVWANNTNPGTATLALTFRNDYTGTASVWFKIYMPATTSTTVKNADNGIQISWKSVDDAKGYVIYRRAWNLKDAGWTTFERWNNTTGTTWTDTKVFAGTRYQYGIKAYYNDPMDNFNLGIVGPLKTTVRITTRTLNSVTPGTKQLTAKWSGSSVFTGYQLQYADNADFTGLKTVTIANNKTYQTTVKNLTAGKTYYVRLRSYHVFDGTTYYGGWSNVLSCKVK